MDQKWGNWDLNLHTEPFRNFEQYKGVLGLNSLRIRTGAVIQCVEPLLKTTANHGKHIVLTATSKLVMAVGSTLSFCVLLCNELRLREIRLSVRAEPGKPIKSNCNQPLTTTLYDVTYSFSN